MRGEQTDLWALGVTMYYLLKGKYPAHEATNLIELREHITTKEIDFSGIKNEDVKEVLMGMLEKDPNKRMTLEDLLKSNWVTNHSKDMIEIN